MAPEKQPERDPVEAAFLAKIAAWTAALESYRAARALDGGVTDVPGLGVSGPMDLPVGVFRDKGVKEAIPIFLGAVRRKQTNKEIASGLKKGGIATTSRNFEATVGTALLRLKDDGVVLRFEDGWDLAASYPDSLKNRLERDSKPAKKRAKGKGAAKNGRRRTPEARSRVKPQAEAASPAAEGPGMEQRITAYLQTRGTEFTTDEELRSQLRAANLQVVRMVLGKMAKSGKIEKDPDGRVRFVKRAA